MLSMPVFAQEQDKAEAQRKIDTLQKQIESLQQDKQRLQDTLASTPENIEKSINNLAVGFKTLLKSPFAKGCIKAGGRPILTYNLQTDQMSFIGCVL